MAGESCSLTCNVKDRNGKVKVSALWEDLTKFFKSNRKESLAHYFLTKDSKFLMENSDILEFDVDGEVTIESLKKAIERDGEYSNLSNAVILSTLNEEIEKELKDRGATGNKVNYSEALDSVLKFNRSDRFKENFMATMKKESDGSYSVKVVERNPQSEYELADIVQNKIVTDAIRLILQDKGLSVEFLDDPTYAVQYSTQNVHLDVDGLQAIASVMNGNSSSLETAEVAGHFIVASMQGNPLIERLVSMLTPDVQKAIFKGDKSVMRRDDFIVAESAAREAAGILVGRALIQPFLDAQKSRNAWGGLGLTKTVASGIISLLKKIGNLSKRIFIDKQERKIRKLVEKARDAASTAAQGFISNPDEADVMQALNNPNTFTSDYSSKHLSDEVKRSVTSYRETLGSLKDTITKLKASIGRAPSPINKDILNRLKDLANNTASQYNHQMSLEAFAKNASVTGMVVLIEGMTDILDTDIRSLLEQIQPSDRAGSYANITQNARNMRTVNTAVKGIMELYLTMSGKLDTLQARESINYEDGNGNTVVNSLRDAVEKLGDVLMGREEAYEDIQGETQGLNGLMHLMEMKRRQVFIDAFADFYGKDFIEYNAGMVWQQRGNKKVLAPSGDRKVAVRDYIDSLEEDISWFDRYWNSAADCGDFVTAVGNKVVKQANMTADRIASRFWDRIETLRLQMKDAFGTEDTRILFEVITDDNGKSMRTGNIVTEVNHGAWEKARDEFKKQLYLDFNDYLVDYRKQYYENNKGVKGAAFRLTDQQKAVLYHQFATPKWEKWHKEHSQAEEVPGGKRWVPNKIKYHNQQWDNLFDVNNPSISAEERSDRTKRLKWYKALMELKADMDNLLPKNAAVPWRAPQMTGRFSHRYRNLKLQMGDSRAFGRALRRKGQDMWAVRPEDAYMFGSNNEFNELEEDPMRNPMFFEKEKINRIPMFGINKLKKMEDLSTDLFGTLTQYGSMAATYRCMENVVDVFELGRDVLKQRKVGNVLEKERNEESKAYGRYAKFMEKGLYGINVVPPAWDRKGTLRKLANSLSSFGGKVLLWGNVHGGIVNKGTGMLEILKEAGAGENFNMSDLLKAHKMYYDGFLFDTDGYFGTMGSMLFNPQRPDDKNSLWIRHWNILSQNRTFLHNQRYDVSMNMLDNRLWEWFGHALMLPYSSGDHYMQTIPYYAMGIHQKVYDHDGNQMSLIDAYEVVDGEEVYAIDAPQGSEALGRTPKKIKLKSHIFRSVEDIKTFDTVQKMVNKIADYFDSHPNVKPHFSISLDFFSDEEKAYLNEEEFKAPINVKQLNTLRTALNSKLIALTFNDTDESEFMDKCRNICNRLHGIYNSEDKVAFQQNFYGNLMMSMRGYALGMINRRYAESRYNVAQQKAVEGNYNTMVKVLMSAVYNSDNIYNWKALSEALLLTVPVFNMYTLFSKNFGERTKADMKKAGFSEHQYYNMRRTGLDFLVLEALALIKFLAAPGRHFGLNDDDDEDGNNKNDTSDNFLSGLLYYFSMRWFNEQGAFTWPGAMWNEGNSLLDWVPAGASGFSAMADIVFLLGETLIDQLSDPDYENSKLYYQQSKKGKYEEGDWKALVKFKRLCPYYRTWYSMSHPYDTASSYEYGRRVRGK